jgi:hypothetical protein
MVVNNSQVSKDRGLRQRTVQAFRHGWTAPQVHCPNCGRDAPPRTYTPGSVGLELVLWVVCFPVGVL